jgi:hypothetical protein
MAVNAAVNGTVDYENEYGITITSADINLRQMQWSLSVFGTCIDPFWVLFHGRRRAI